METLIKQLHTAAMKLSADQLREWAEKLEEKAEEWRMIADEVDQEQKADQD